MDSPPPTPSELRHQVVRIMAQDILIGRFSGDLILALAKVCRCPAETIETEVRSVARSNGLRVTTNFPSGL
jgi:hypothetical protein